MKKNMMVGMLVAFLANLFIPATLAGGWVPTVDLRGNGGIISISEDAFGPREVVISRSTLHQQGRAPITVEVVAYLGTTKDGATYSWFTETVLKNLVNNDWRTYVNLKVGQSVGLGHRLYPEYVTAHTGAVTGKDTVWFGVVLTSTEPFDPSGLTFVATSTDTNNIFGKTEVFGGTPYIYAGTSIGIRADGTMVTSGSWLGQPVNKFAFIGSACSTMNANTVQEAEDAANWMKFQKDFKITGTWSITESGQTYSASYELRQDPTPASLRIIRREVSGVSELVVVVNSLGEPVHLQKAGSVTGPWYTVWDFLTTGVYRASGEGNAFFRTVEWGH